MTYVFHQATGSLGLGVGLMALWPYGLVLGV